MLTDRAWLLDTSATLGSLILFLVLIAVVVLVAGFVVIGVVRMIAESVRAAKGRPSERVAVPFGGPGNADADPDRAGVDMPAGLEHMTPEQLAKAAERAQAIANMGAGGVPGPGPGVQIRPTGAVQTGDVK